MYIRVRVYLHKTFRGLSKKDLARAQKNSIILRNDIQPKVRVCDRARASFSSVIIMSQSCY